VTVSARAMEITVTLDIVPDEDSPYALLAACDDNGSEIAQVRVAPTFKLNRASAAAWIENDFRRPE
jgi:hypothetical protein